MRVFKQSMGLVAGMLAAVVLTAGAMIVSTAEAATIASGKPAPDFSVIDSQGRLRTLDEFAGKRVVLEWTNKGCPYVGKHYSDPRRNMQTLQNELTGAEPELVWLTVISSGTGRQGYLEGAEAEAHADNLGAHPSAILIDADGVMGRAYGAKATPHMFLIDRDDAQTLLYSGAIDTIRSSDPADIDEAENYIIRALDQISAGKVVQPDVTTPYGCGVKYGS